MCGGGRLSMWRSRRVPSFGSIFPRISAWGEFDSYSRCYVNLTEWSPEIYTFKNDTLRFYLGEEHPVLEIPGAELLKTQLERSGFDPSRGVEPTGEEALRLLDYRDERCRILFERLMIERLDSADRLSVEAVHSLWLR